MKNICIIAGETSGDIHAAKLVRAMKSLDPELAFFGIGGDDMAREGVELLAHINEMNFMGFIEVIKHIPRIKRLMTRLISEIGRRDTDLIIPVDYPGFNLKLVEKVKTGGQSKIPKVFWYISPQVWAWGSGRIPKLARLVDRMAGILPFETDTYAGTGLDFHFTGHPLLDDFEDVTGRKEFFIKHGLNPERKLIALLPGSRTQEVGKLLPVMLEAAGQIRQKIDSEFAVGAAHSVDKALYENISSARVIYGGTRALMINADFVITASGTATLETAVAGTPMLVVYKLNPLSYHIGKRLVKLKNIALTNVVAGERIVPELIQEMASAENIAEETLKILSNDDLMRTTKLKLKVVREQLGNPGASRRAAELALDIII